MLCLRDGLLKFQTFGDGNIQPFCRREFVLQVSDAGLDFVAGLDADLFQLDGQRDLLLNGVAALKAL